MLNYRFFKFLLTTKECHEKNKTKSKQTKNNYNNIRKRFQLSTVLEIYGIQEIRQLILILEYYQVLTSLLKQFLARIFFKKGVLKIDFNSHQKAPAAEVCFLIHLFTEKKRLNARVFRAILEKFSAQSFNRTPANGCFCL